MSLSDRERAEGFRNHTRDSVVDRAEFSGNCNSSFANPFENHRRNGNDVRNGNKVEA